jgi:hypothetical protein
MSTNSRNSGSNSNRRSKKNNGSRPPTNRNTRFSASANGPMALARSSNVRPNNERPKPPSLSILSHGGTNAEFFIVPDGYKLTFYAQSGDPLEAIHMVNKYYLGKYDDTYTTIKESGDIVRNVDMSLLPFFQTQEILTSYLPYIGPLPTYKTFRKAIPGVTLIDGDRKHPDFENISHTTDLEIYKKYYEVYKYLRHYNDYLGDKTEMDIKQLNFLADFFDTPEDDKEFQMKISNPNYDMNKDKDFIKILNKNKEKEEKLKEQLFYIKTDKTESFINEVQTKINKSSFLFEPVAKNERALKNLKQIFQIGNNFSVINLLNEFKPGEYNFFMCRSYEKDIENSISENTLKGSLVRQSSVENVKKTRRSKGQQKEEVHMSSPYYKFFGGINGKIVIIARFIEHIIKKYSKIKSLHDLILQINLLELSECKTFKFYHDLIINCSHPTSNCHQI